MNKELTPLQALKNIRTLFIGSPIDLSYQLNVIEIALKDYEKQKQLVQTLQDKIYVKEMKYAKQEKALEIIKSKELNVFFIKRYSLEDFNYMCRYEQQLTQEEYDLLRDIMKRKEDIR